MQAIDVNPVDGWVVSTQSSRPGPCCPLTACPCKQVIFLVTLPFLPPQGLPCCSSAWNSFLSSSSGGFGWFFKLLLEGAHLQEAFRAALCPPQTG